MPEVNCWHIEIHKVAFPNRRCQSKTCLLVLLRLFVLHRVADLSCVYLCLSGKLHVLMYVIHDCFPAAPWEVMPFDSLRLAEVHDVLGSFLHFGWLCPFKINFTKKYSIPTCERNLCFTESKGFWWQFWATLENSGEKIICVMSFISCSIDSHSAALPVWPLSTCSKSSQSWYLAIYYYIKPL